MLQENKNLHEKIDALVISRESNPASASPSTELPTPTFAEMVKDSVKTAFRDEKCKREVIITSIEEKGNDEAVVAGLCDRFQLPNKPTEVMRIGSKKKSSGEGQENVATPSTSKKQRLLKVSFPSPFDARAFYSRYSMLKTLRSSASEWDEQ